MMVLRRVIMKYVMMIAKKAKNFVENRFRLFHANFWPILGKFQSWFQVVSIHFIEKTNFVRHDYPVDWLVPKKMCSQFKLGVATGMCFEW